ncbi:unnamed protein product [Albugo candida]|nr:unnamed protein product [Albugo candida]|eukprot:CCI49423.1 unnamed protein product [Albugo candida]
MDTFMQGFNVTVVAYGQTGSGKTFTMGNQANRTMDAAYFIAEDAQDSNYEDGLIPRFLNEYFGRMEKEKEERRHEFQVFVSYLEIYGEEIHDLLEPRMSVSDNLVNGNASLEKLQLREGKSGVYVQGLSEIRVQSCEEAMEQMRVGCLRRITGSTEMNDHSSRSHAVYTVKMVRYVRRSRPHESTSTGSSSGSGSGSWIPSERCDADNYKCDDENNGLREEILNATIISKLTFVDLAGSERLKKTMAEGTRMKEGIQINSGLLALGNVINALGVERRRPNINAFVPYRASKLTRLLQDALGGNSRTLFIACVSSTHQSLNETHSTLQYANRAKNIQNKAVKNIDTRTAEMMALRAINSLFRRELLKARLLLPNKRETISSNSTQTEAYLEKLLQDPSIIEILQKMEELAVSAYDSCVPLSALAEQCETLWARSFVSETVMNCGTYSNSQIASSTTNGTSSTNSSISSRFLLGGDDCVSDISCSCSQSGVYGCTCGESSATVSTNGDGTFAGEDLIDLQNESQSCSDVVKGHANCQNWNTFLAVLEVVSLSLEIRLMRQNVKIANEGFQEKIQRQTKRVDRCKCIANTAYEAFEQARSDSERVEIAKKRVEALHQNTLHLEEQLKALYDQCRQQNEKRHEEIRRKCIHLEITRRSIKHRNHEMEKVQPLDVLFRSEEVKRRFGIQKLCQVAEKIQIENDEMAILLNNDSDRIARGILAFSDPLCSPQKLKNENEPLQTAEILMREFNDIFNETIEMEVLEATYSVQVRSRTRLIEELSDSELEMDPTVKEQQLAECESNIRRLTDLLDDCGTLEKSQLRNRFDAALHSIPSLDSALHIIRKMAEEVHVHRRLLSRNCLELTDTMTEKESNDQIPEKLMSVEEHQEKMQALMIQHEEELADILCLQGSKLDSDTDKTTETSNKVDAHARQIHSLSSKFNVLNEKLKDVETERDIATHKAAQADEKLSVAQRQIESLKTRMEQAKEDRELSGLLEKCRTMWRELGRNVSDENAKFQDINTILRQRCNEELAELENTRKRLTQRAMNLYDQVKMVEKLLHVEKDAQVVSFHELCTITSDSLLQQEQYLSARYKTHKDTIRDRLQVKIRMWQNISEILDVLQIRQATDFRYISGDRVVHQFSPLNALTLILYGNDATNTQPALSVWKEFLADPMRLDGALGTLQGDGNSFFSENALSDDKAFRDALCEEKSARLKHLGEYFREIERLSKQMEFSLEELHRFGMCLADDRMNDTKIQNTLLTLNGKGGHVDLCCVTLDFLERLKCELAKVFQGRQDAMRCFQMTLGLVAKLRSDMFQARGPDLHALLSQHTWDLNACASKLKDLDVNDSAYCTLAAFRMGKRCLLNEAILWHAATRAFLSTINAEMSPFGIESNADRMRFLLGSKNGQERSSDRLLLERFYNDIVQEKQSNGQDSLILEIDPIFMELGVFLAPSYAKESIHELQDLARDIESVEQLVQRARVQLSSLQTIMKLYTKIDKYNREIAIFNEEASKKSRLYGSSDCLVREARYRAKVAKEYPTLLTTFKIALCRWGIRKLDKDKELRHIEQEFDPSILGAEFQQFLRNMVNTKTVLLHLDLAMMNVQADGSRRSRMSARSTTTTAMMPRSGSMQALVSPTSHRRRRARTSSTSYSTPRRNHSNL